MSVPDRIARRWLAAELAHASIAAAGSTGVYDHPAPSGSIDPFVTVQYLRERPISPIGKNSAELYRIEELIRAWEPGSSSARVDDIAGAIHARLQKAGPVAVSGGLVISCYRVAGVPFDSIVENGETIRISGGVYAIHVLVD